MRKSFLAIEPDSSERKQLQKFFSNDYLLTFADTAAEALEIMSNREFPVIVFNMGRAQNDSFGELNALKTHRDKNPMIIAITTYNDLKIEKSIAEVGVFYHLLKPYNEKDLHDLIDAAILAWQRKYLLSPVGDCNHE
jgi:DNA-binding NtrC family response regulator